jgi:DtxR family Mn-dependent transcriptional regulator
MPSITKENYLKALFFLHQKNEEIAISDLSKNLDLSTPTVNSMVKKLEVIGWVNYKKYKPIRLTAKGEKEAALVIRKHRLTEIFLSKIMGFGWEEVHDIAEEIEHIKSEKLFDKMDEILGYPTVDPHGSPIPSKSGEIVQEEFLKLSQCKKNSKVKLCSLADSSAELLLFLNSKDIKLGTELIIIGIEPFDQSYTVAYDSISSLMLSTAVCERLLVKEI